MLTVRRRASTSADVVGLDVQPGELVAALVRRDDGLRVERAVGAAIDAGIVREGEVADVDGLARELKQLFGAHKLPSRVRVGLSSPRAVMRVVDLPPLEDEKDIAAAIRIQAVDHIPMPLSHAVVDHHTVGLVDTPDGRRTRTVVVAAMRESVDRLLAALRRAGLRPVGVDLSAFALVRGLHPAGDLDPAPRLYAQVAGVTTLAVARGATCELARTAPIGLEALTARLAEREGIVLSQARERLLAYGRPETAGDEAALAVLDHGLAELADELRNTTEFHAAQVAGGVVSEVVLSGAVASIPGVARVLEERIGSPVRLAVPAEGRPGAFGDVDPARASVATGLTVEELAA